jgi:hypothetical protein
MKYHIRVRTAPAGAQFTLPERADRVYAFAIAWNNREYPSLS